MSTCLRGAYRAMLLGHYVSRAQLLQSSMPPYLRIATRTARLPRTRFLHASLSTRLQRASKAPELNTSIPPQLHASNAPPDLPGPMPPRLHASTALLELHASIPLCFYVCTPGARLQRFLPLYLHICTPATSSRVPELRTFIPPRCHIYSAPPTSSELHDCIPSCRYAYI